jgi:hypothetical protein
VNRPVTPPSSQRARFGFLTAAVAAILSFSACDDDPFNFNDWTAAPDTVVIYSLDRPELNLPSAYSFYRRGVHRVEAANSSGQWDVALDTREGGLVLLAPRALGIDATAGIVPMPDQRYDEIREAPADTSLYISDEPVPVVVGQLYVVRTNEALGAYGQRCSYYGKMEPLAADPVLGILEFRLDSNPICNNRDLVPPSN